MRKFKHLNLTEQYYAMLLTKIQEAIAYLIWLSSSDRITQILIKALAFISKRHFKLFYMTDIVEVGQSIKFLEYRDREQVCRNVLIPYFRRQVKILAFSQRKILGVKTSELDVVIKSHVFMMAFLTGKSPKECLDKLICNKKNS